MSYVYARKSDEATSDERSFTHTPVYRTATYTCVAGERGKQQAFTDEQLEALRSAMREWKSRPENEGLSQKEVGARLKVSQQTYSKFEAGVSGAGYATATHIARLAGFDGVDSFFADRGVSVPGQRVTHTFLDPFPKRELAANKMIGLKQITPEAYDMVREDAEYNKPSHASKDGYYWSTVLEAAQRFLTTHQQDTMRRENEARAKLEAQKHAPSGVVRKDQKDQAPKSSRKRGAA